MFIFGMMFVLLFVLGLTAITISAIGSGKNQWISLIIIGLSLIASIYYFYYMRESFTTNLMKYPGRILPNVVLLICITSIITFICLISEQIQMNEEKLMIFCIGFVMIYTMFVMFPALIADNVIKTINEVVTNKKEVSNNKTYKIIEKKQNNKSYYIKISMNDINCNYFILSLDSKIKKHVYLENEAGKKYLIGEEFYLNNKKYNENNQECKKGDNIISFEMIEK